MNARRTTTIALSLTLFAGLGAVVSLVYSHQTLGTLEEEKRGLAQRVQALANERTQLRNEIARLELAPAASKPGPPDVTEELKAALDEIIAMRQHTPAPQKAWQPYPRGAKGDVFPELLADPEYVRHYSGYQSLTLELQYADFYATTSASPEAVEKLRHALMQRSIGLLEREELIAKHGVPDSERGELSHLLGQKFDAEVREILGETAFAEFKRYDDMAMTRIAITAFKERLSYSEPLSNAQETALLDILVTTTMPYGNRQIPAQKFTAAVMERAKTVLSPAQWEAMKIFQQERDAAARK